MVIARLTSTQVAPNSWIQKIRAAEDAWNARDPERVSLAYTVDSQWRNRSEIFQGRPKIVEFLTRKWNRELDYRLIKRRFHWDRSRPRPADHPGLTEARGRLRVLLWPLTHPHPPTRVALSASAGRHAG